MKDIKSTLSIHTAIAAGATVSGLVFMSLPALAATRESLTASLGLSGQLNLWVPVGSLIAACHGLAYFLSLKKIARPLQKLATNASHCEHGFAFKTRSNSAEEDTIKHAIEANNLKTREAIQQAEELQEEVRDLKSQLEAAQFKIQTISAENEEAVQAVSELRVERETLKATNTALETTLENERKTKIGVEVEKRAEEIYAQMERAISAASLKSLWLPSFVQELKEPAALINEISGGLRDNCNNTPISTIAAQIEQIHKQAEKQLATLQAILDRQPADMKIDAPREPAAAPAPATTGEVEPELEEVVAEIATIEIEEETEDSFQAGHREIGLSVQAEPEATIEKVPEENPYAVETVLQKIIEEFSPRAMDAHMSYTVDTDLGIEIADETLLGLMHSLTQAAVNSVEEGEITLGIDLTTEHLIFDVACEGDLTFSDPACVDKANRLAVQLGGQIDIDRPSEKELHFSFAYPIGDEDGVGEEDDAVDIQSQLIGNEPLS
ncbi:hypothetical protein IEN85_13855 [Pelagicoccus sp. NFK12]|uniref:Uncharacterized protein n=1 Tax=Pelagicoccus enzymogenes TaxID=2773457 RepID=A0A927FA60_9BACT|nr:hypothetical protein [Pelagicoccus enzymogenes]MBD5780581.1 hypothetical protein [Pelagicoccus enzymogenes]